MANYPLNDPYKLLELKRLESDALLDVLRTINLQELTIPQLCMITRNLLRAQLGVKFVKFIYRYDEEWREGINLGFGTLSEAATAELFTFKKVTQITAAQPGLQGVCAEYVVPIMNRNQAVGYFLIADFAESEVEAQSDLIFIETLGNILYVAIQNKQLFQERIAQEFLRKELEVAETIQRQLLLSDFTRFTDLDIFGLNVPHHGIGGDFYDIVQKGDGVTFVAIADVSGKGIGAALLMSNLQANLRALCARYDSPAAIVRELNAILYQISGGDKFVTLFLAGIDAGSGTLTYVNAGHCYPIFLHGGESAQLESSCMLLGILPTLPVQETTLEYVAGDTLFMFTDGIVEQENPQGEMYGSDRIVQALHEVGNVPAVAIVRHLQAQLARFAAGTETADDVTMLCVKA